MFTQPRFSFKSSLNLKFSSPLIKPWLLVACLPATLYLGCGDSSSSAHDEIQSVSKPTETEDMISGTELESSEYTLLRSDRGHDDSPEVSSESFAQHITANQDFSFTLHQEALPKDKANAMLSAWSVRQAFALLLPGTNESGREAISETLGFDADLDNALRSANSLNDELETRQIEASEYQRPVILQTANSIWVNHNSEIQNDYLDLISEHLDTGVYMVDFKGEPERSRQVINSWVEEKTQDKIQNLLPRNSINEHTQTVFTNAVFFKAPWQTPFDAQLTTEASFTTSMEESITSVMMKGEQYAPAAIVDGIQVLTLPFRGNKLAMTFLMPMEETLDELEASLSSERWEELLDQQVDELRMVTLPKFKFETEVPDLEEYFKEKETQLLFESKAIDRVLNEQALVISKIIHKSFIEINETGGEAAAATAIIAREPSIPDYGPEVVINRAFLFAIHDQVTGAILFLGKVGNPAE